MGFTKFEKESLKLLLRSEEETEKLRDSEISDEAQEYLKNSDLLYNLKDYSFKFPVTKNPTFTLAPKTAAIYGCMTSV